MLLIILVHQRLILRTAETFADSLLLSHKLLLEQTALNLGETCEYHEACKASNKYSYCHPEFAKCRCQENIATGFGHKLQCLLGIETVDCTPAPNYPFTGVCRSLSFARLPSIATSFTSLSLITILTLHIALFV